MVRGEVGGEGSGNGGGGEEEVEGVANSSGG